VGAFLEKHITNDTTLGIWKCNDLLSNDLESISLKGKDLELFAKIKTEVGQKQFLGVRLMLRHLLPEMETIDLQKTINGRPFIKGVKQKISISHSGDFVAVLISENNEVGVDIELIGDKVLRVKNKFMSDFELDCFDKLDPDLRRDFSHLLWGAKEALFKLYSKGEVSFKENLLLAPFELKEAGTFIGNIKTSAININCELHYFKVLNYMLVCALKS